MHVELCQIFQRGLIGAVKFAHQISARFGKLFHKGGAAAPVCDVHGGIRQTAAQTNLTVEQGGDVTAHFVDHVVGNNIEVFPVFPNHGVRRHMVHLVRGLLRCFVLRGCCHLHLCIARCGLGEGDLGFQQVLGGGPVHLFDQILTQSGHLHTAIDVVVQRQKPGQIGLGRRGWLWRRCEIDRLCGLKR